MHRSLVRSGVTVAFCMSLLLVGGAEAKLRARYFWAPNHIPDGSSTGVPDGYMISTFQKIVPGIWRDFDPLTGFDTVETPGDFTNAPYVSAEYWVDSIYEPESARLDAPLVDTWAMQSDLRDPGYRLSRDGYCVIAAGGLTIDQAGTYEFKIESSDGAMVWIDTNGDGEIDLTSGENTMGNEIINACPDKAGDCGSVNQLRCIEDSAWAFAYVSCEGTYRVEFNNTGLAKIMVWYWNWGEVGHFALSWKKPGGVMQPISGSNGDLGVPFGGPPGVRITQVTVDGYVRDPHTWADLEVEECVPVTFTAEASNMQDETPLYLWDFYGDGSEIHTSNNSVITYRYAADPSVFMNQPSVRVKRGETVSEPSSRRDVIFIWLVDDPDVPGCYPEWPPTITNTAARTTVIDSLFTDTIHARDPDDATLSYGIDGDTSGMTLTDSILTWTPSAYETRTVIYKASDGNTEDTMLVTITVTSNPPRFIGSDGTLQLFERDTLFDTLRAVDPDNDPLTFSLSGAPTGMSLTDSIVTWTGVAPDSGIVTCRVSDGTNLVSLRRDWVVLDVNDPPRFYDPVLPEGYLTGDIVDGAVLEAKDSYRGAVFVQDPDPSDHCRGATGVSVETIDGPTGLTVGDVRYDVGGAVCFAPMSWTPAVGDTGEQTIVLMVSDGELTDTLTWTIVVFYDAPPRIDSSVCTTARRNSLYTDTLRVLDDFGPVRWSLLYGPDNLVLRDSIVEWTPRDSGQFAVALRVGDGHKADTLAFVITVDPGTAPRIDTTSLTRRTGDDESLCDTIVGIDAEGDSLTYELIAGPAGLLLVEGFLLWASPVAGHHAVVIDVSDGLFTGRTAYMLRVDASSTATHAAPPAPSSGIHVHGNALTFTLPASATIDLSLFDLTGRLVHRLHRALGPGIHSEHLQLPTGRYLCRFDNGDGAIRRESLAVTR